MLSNQGVMDIVRLSETHEHHSYNSSHWGVLCRSSRIINVSSSAQLFGDINFSDPNYSSGGYQPWVAYGQSKLANAMFSLELAKRIPLGANVTSNSLHPGVVNTELARCVYTLAHMSWECPGRPWAMCSVPRL